MKKKKILDVLEFLSQELRVEIENLKYGIISHPLTSSLHVIKEGEFFTLNKKTLPEYVKWRIDKLRNEAKNVERIFVEVNKPYRITLLSLVKDCLNQKEFNETLRWVWIDTEFPNQESVFTLIELFKKSKKELLMNKEQLAKLESLPKKIVIYRGLQDERTKKRGLSWTLSLEKARWFANRWDKEGDVLSAEIDKEDIFYYTDLRGEEEVVVNPFKLKNLIKIENGR